MSSIFTVGIITGTHGIKGTLKIYPYSDETNNFKKYKEVIIESEGITSVYEVENVALNKKLILMKLKGVDNIDAALTLKGCELKIDGKYASPLNEGEFYIRDLIGLSVITVDGEKLGEVTNVLRTGANDVYEISNSLYIPAIKQCVLNIDISNRTMNVKLLEGLR